MATKPPVDKARHRNTVFPRSTANVRDREALRPAFSDCAISRDRQKLRRMIPVNQPNTVSPPRATVTVPLAKDESSPWDRYQTWMKLEQAGPAMAVYIKNSTFDERVAKEIKIHDKKQLKHIRPMEHCNIVKFHEALYYQGSVYLFYELMDVSLAQIFGTPLGTLLHFEVAAWCKEVLEGLNYIHTKLNSAHGDLSSRNILLSAGTAEVKIGIFRF